MESKKLTGEIILCIPTNFLSRRSPPIYVGQLDPDSDQFRAFLFSAFHMQRKQIF